MEFAVTAIPPRMANNSYGILKRSIVGVPFQDLPDTFDKKRAMKMLQFLWICLGGALGTGARYLLSGWVLSLLGPSVPYSTLTVNLLGSFLIGVINYLGFNSEIFSPHVRTILTIGVMGGFTTYSSFNYETLQYLQEGIWFLGILNILVMVMTCLLAGILGFMAAKWLLGN